MSAMSSSLGPQARMKVQTPAMSSCDSHLSTRLSTHGILRASRSAMRNRSSTRNGEFVRPPTFLTGPTAQGRSIRTHDPIEGTLCEAGPEVDEESHNGHGGPPFEVGARNRATVGHTTSARRAAPEGRHDRCALLRGRRCLLVSTPHLARVCGRSQEIR